MEQSEKIGALIYTLITQLAGDKPMSSFLKPAMTSPFYKAARGVNLGPITLKALEKVCPDITGYIDNSDPKALKLTRSGEQCFERFSKKGQLLSPKARRGAHRVPAPKAEAVKVSVNGVTAPTSLFELGGSITSLGGRPEASLWLEKLDSSLQAGVPFGDFVKAVRLGVRNG
jgi:hypothetical protein